MKTITADAATNEPIAVHNTMSQRIGLTYFSATAASSTT